MLSMETVQIATGSNWILQEMRKTAVPNLE